MQSLFKEGSNDGAQPPKLLNSMVPQSVDLIVAIIIIIIMKEMSSPRKS